MCVRFVMTELGTLPLLHVAVVLTTTSSTLPLLHRFHLFQYYSCLPVNIIAIMCTGHTAVAQLKYAPFGAAFVQCYVHISRLAQQGEPGIICHVLMSYSYRISRILEQDRYGMGWKILEEVIYIYIDANKFSPQPSVFQLVRK